MRVAGVHATKVGRASIQSGTAKQWYAATYNGILLKRLGGSGEFHSAIKAAEAYALALAADTPQGQAKAYRYGGTSGHGGACALEEACGHGGAVAETSPSASASTRSSEWPAAKLP